MLYYREDLLEKRGFSGPPKTWSELMEQTCKVMQDAGMGNGFVFQGARYEGGVVNGLEYKDAANEFVGFATSPEQQKFQALNGSFLPTLGSLYDDREILEKVPVIALGKEAIENARPRPLSPYFSDMSLKMAEQFNASLKGAKSPEEAIRTLDRELQEIVDLGETS